MANDEKEIITCAKGVEYTEKFTDVVLIVDDKEIPVHRQILALRSEYFEIMFYGKFDESQKTRIEIENVKWLPFKKIINYLYTGKLVAKPIDAPDIYSIAHMLGLSDVTEKIAIFMLNNLHEDNFAEYINCAYKFDLSTLANACNAFCVADFKRVEDKICGLSEEAVLGFLCSKMDSNNEMNKFNLTRNWLKANDEKKAKMFMSTIKLSNLTINDIQLTVRPSGYFTDTELLDAIFNIMASDKRSKQSTTGPFAIPSDGVGKVVGGSLVVPQFGSNSTILWR